MRVLKHEQGLAKIETLIKHWRSPNTEAEAHVRIALQWNQYTAGTGVPILEDHQSIPHLETVWYPDLRNFLSENKIKIKVDHPGIVPHQREGDSHIMDHILATKRFTKGQLLRINYCRLYLNAHTISDIATACGRFLCPSLLKGNLDPIDRNWKANHPIQEKPNAASWKIWNRACTMICLDRRRKTIRPLGQWTVP